MCRRMAGEACDGERRRCARLARKSLEVVITSVASTLLKLYEPKFPSAPHPFAAGPVRRNTSRLLEPFPTSYPQH